MFSYNSEHQVIVCSDCHSCIVPGRSSQTRHLRNKHHLNGDTLKATLQRFSSYNVRTIKELQASKPKAEHGDKVAASIKDLAIYKGFRCLWPSCIYRSCSLERIKEHAATHKKTLALAEVDPCASPLWAECTLQTYFTAKGLIDYFVVADKTKKDNKDQGVVPLTKLQEAYLREAEKDFEDVKDDIAKQAAIVQDFGDSRSAVVPWLQKTAFPSHIAGLTDDEIKGSFKLPSKKIALATVSKSKGKGKDKDKDDEDKDLRQILDAVEAVFQDAYELCSDTSPNRKMTQQRANILNEFYAGASGKSDGFRYYKDASSLADYLRTWKQLLTYFYQVVYSKSGHFTRTSPDQKLPQDIIEPTSQQLQAMEAVVYALNKQDQEQEDKESLKHAVRKLCLSLICQTVGSIPFKSVVLSFCAMLSKTKKGQWQEPSNFNSYLSALTWTAQLIIFDYACFYKQDDEDSIPTFLAQICKQFFQQLAETPFGYILQWRLYLFVVSKNEISKH